MLQEENRNYYEMFTLSVSEYHAYIQRSAWADLDASENNSSGK